MHAGVMQILSRPSVLLLLFTATTIKAIKNATANTPAIAPILVNRFSSDDRRLHQLDFLFSKTLLIFEFNLQHFYITHSAGILMALHLHLLSN